jgi:hypothetical protein
MTLLRIALVAAVAFTAPVVAPAPADARQIERACIQSGRRAASRSLCTCIQGVADQLLTGREQRLAASFFEDPHRAQELRTSDRQRDETFWKRYKQFGSVAAQRCG